MGMVLLPISRHSALASFFVISTSTTLTNHVFAAYTLFTLVIIHGLLYVSWIPVFNSLSDHLRTVIPVLNPTYLYKETWPGNTSSLGIWRASLIFTGTSAAIIMAALFVTTFPQVRQRHFNLFYFTHVFSILMVVIICLHASTMFYCTSPGLAMWVLDWSMRIYELRGELKGNIKALGSSIRELHPFTTITHLASQNNSTHPSDEDLPIQFLFRKSEKSPSSLELEKALARRSLVQRILRSKGQRMKSVQWTAKLAALADQTPLDRKAELSTTCEDARKEHMSMTSEHGFKISLRLEGPYFTPADPHRYNTVVCIVAGTGVSGALAIAAAFVHSSLEGSRTADAEEQASREKSPRPWRRCIIMWSVKAQDDIDLPIPTSCEGLEVRKFLTGDGRKRVDLKYELDRITCGGEGSTDGGNPNRTWVYVSGPKAFIAAGKEACTTVQKKKESKVSGWMSKGSLDFYAASWDP
ncbi:uncharacterized protein KY384_000380 [Bacidia gigantensis]|uniref:uncharacterized protein n=1 Tax=Bacidia gigantensis TaxID=2732470 RepID=UPI001D057081|nr:uncharacterized protein KY384_000380 [Bacidia gigantensis]KAG8526386.1 hypothetical protein KY384_000380 [Bacidia gigantensis]